jgi:hypothetical protein
MDAEQFLKFFEDRRFTVLLKKGSLAVEPFGKLNHDDHKTIAKVAADPGARATLTRLLCEREEALVRGLSPDQAHAVDRTRAAFDATLVEIKPVEIRPGVPVTPSPKNPEQSRLFASNIRQKPVDVSESATPAGAQVCAHCACRRDDPQTVRCPNCNTLLDSIEPSTPLDDEEPFAEYKPYPSPKMDRLPDREADAELDSSPNHDDAEIPASAQPEIKPHDGPEPVEYVCALCRHRVVDPKGSHCGVCGGLLLPAAAVATPIAEVVAPAAESDEQPPFATPPHVERATAEQIAEIERLAALVWPDDAEQEPVPQITSVSASAGRDSTSSRPQKMRSGAPMGHEIPDDAAPIAIATALPAIPARVHKPVEREICVWTTQRPTNRGLMNQLDVAATSAARAAGLRVLVEELDSSTRPKWHTLVGPARLTRNGLQAVSPRPMRLKLKYRTIPCATHE